jgi:putative mRNA 3-end processing factor
MDLIVPRPEGLYCPPGDFFIDPWQPVDHAVLTHGHGDHARPGSKAYLAALPGRGILRRRLGDEADIQTLSYGERIDHRGVRLSLHPAGHILGSAQIRVEHEGRVWVVSGDYKRALDPTCDPFDPVVCDVFVTESTFGLPIYQWPDPMTTLDEVNAWWRENAAAGRTSVLFAYALGKAQRILSGLDTTIGDVLTHGAVEALNQVYRDSCISLPPTRPAHEVSDRALLKKALVLAPPSAQGTPWLKRFGSYSDAFASGWMQVRGIRRRRNVDRGFVLSDHADWPALLATIEASRATRVIVTHGHVDVLVRYLAERGLEAQAFDTHYGAEEDAEGARSAPGIG